ncbi:hypothetical protein HDV57DRAFT_355730 [Trichoderma longibrachiatum]
MLYYEEHPHGLLVVCPYLLSVARTYAAAAARAASLSPAIALLPRSTCKCHPNTYGCFLQPCVMNHQQPSHHLSFILPRDCDAEKRRLIGTESAPSWSTRIGYPETGCYDALHPTSILRARYSRMSSKGIPRHENSFR